MIITEQRASKKNKCCLSLPLGSSKVVWIPESNKYLLVEAKVGNIIGKLISEDRFESILDYCSAVYGCSPDEAEQIINQLKNKLSEITQSTQSKTSSNFNSEGINFACKRYYKIYNTVFYFEYETLWIEHLIHPKFAHLEINATPNIANHFQLFKCNTEVVLNVNGKTIGSWKSEEGHYFTGKVSMEILQKVYSNKEDDWMAVFHAAAVSNGRDSILFLGDSGNGKSTLSAILLASGYDVLSDDFLPVESETMNVCAFPSAISVKKNAIDVLCKQFPELHNAHEYHYPLFDKTVRYLSNSNTIFNAPRKVPCKALVFVKYEAKSELHFRKLQKEIAFKKLVPDSWISPSEKNAEQFLKWFKQMPCYELIYSDNTSMIEAVEKIFSNDL